MQRFRLRPALFVLILTVAVALAPRPASAHCEVPCGIFDDAQRISIMHEHVTTIEKSMRQLEAIEAAENQDLHQYTRWILNKEKHAEELQHVVSQYWLHQRIKPAGADDAEYVGQLVLLHEILFHAMKTKHGIDESHIGALREKIDAFAATYFDAEELEHILEHRSH